MFHWKDLWGYLAVAGVSVGWVGVEARAALYTPVSAVADAVVSNRVTGIGGSDHKELVGFGEITAMASGSFGSTPITASADIVLDATSITVTVQTQHAMIFTGFPPLPDSATGQVVIDLPAGTSLTLLGAPSGATGARQSIVGPGGPIDVGSLFNAEVPVPAGRYTLSAACATVRQAGFDMPSGNVLAIGVIPEPQAAVVGLVLATVGAASRRRR